MAYDEGLAQRVREYLLERSNVYERKMFGGLCFMISGHMCCGIVGNKLMARVGPLSYEQLLKEEHAEEMNFTGKPMKGMLYVNPAGLQSDKNLQTWIERCLDFTLSLPPKK